MGNELYCPMKMTSNPLGRCVCLVDCMEAGQHRNEDEEVITLGNTPKAWSWQTSTDRS